ncbi:MAG TPA: methyltransferase domain-containing protein [Allosphingosinicella sp.]|jgi:SAM-dependent methyltransferase
MDRSKDAELIEASAEGLYGAGQAIWDPSDRWNRHKRNEIDTFGRRWAAPLMNEAGTVLDVGCGSEPYAWLPAGRISVDRFAAQVAHLPNAVAASIERLPLRDQSVDFTVCVGSVLNYASAAEAVAEIGRISKPGAWLLLHFESSTSFEHVLTSRWRSPVVRLETLNGGRSDTIWVYRPAYVFDLLGGAGFRLRRQHRFHIVSTLALRASLSQQLAAPLAKLERLLPWLRTFADDVILLAERS